MKRLILAMCLLAPNTALAGGSNYESKPVGMLEISAALAVIIACAVFLFLATRVGSKNTSGEESAEE